MFTVPSSGSGGIILVARPSASTGTITNPTNAYDLPSGRPDDYPYLTSADRATVTGSATPGTVDYATVEYNTFPSRSKTNFTQCSLNIVTSSYLIATATTLTGSGPFTTTYVTPSLSIDYQVDGTTWITIKLYDVKVQNGLKTFVSLGEASNSKSVTSFGGDSPGTGESTTYTKDVVSAIIPASSFPSNLNSLKLRFRLVTCTSTVDPTFKSSVTYNIWDIRANLT